MKVIKTAKPIEYHVRFGKPCCEEFRTYKQCFIIDNGQVELRTQGDYDTYGPNRETIYIPIDKCIFCGEPFVFEEVK